MAFNEPVDTEAAPREPNGPASRPDSDGEKHSSTSVKGTFHRLLRSTGVEENGIVPLPVSERTSTKFFKIFTLWCSINTNILG